MDTSPASFVSPEEIVCVTPPWDAVETVEIRVSDCGGLFRTAGVPFSYAPPIVVSGFAPEVIPEDSNVTVRIFGSGFVKYSPQLQCQFNEVVVPARWVVEGTVECVAPPLPVGDIAVFVSNNGVDAVEVTKSLRVEPRRTVVSLSPPAGPMRGGTRVVVSGTGFNWHGDDGGGGGGGGGMMTGLYSPFCNFGHMEVLAIETSASEIKCVSPSYHVEGGVAFSVSVRFQRTKQKIVFSGGDPLTFTYQPFPLVWSFAVP